MSKGVLIRADDSFIHTQSFEELLQRIGAMVYEANREAGCFSKTTTVFGPIAPKNGRSMAENLQALTNAGLHLVEQGWTVVDIPSFDEVVLRLFREAGETGDPALFLVTYWTEPLMRSGVLTAVHFTPNWRQSTGATREYELALQLGLTVEEISEYIR